MNKNEYGYNAKIFVAGHVFGNGEYHDRRYELPLHEVKAAAGRDFHQPFIKSVCVYDYTGKVCLYLKKNDDGTITREEND
jgi:hypothetical protein